MDKILLSFKPVCTEILKNCTVEKLEELAQLLEKTEPNFMQELQEYLLFPLFIVASNPIDRSEEKIIKIEKCVKLICMNSNIRVFQIFFDLMLQFQLIIDKTNPGNANRLQSEEVKLAAVQSIHHLLKCCSNQVLQELISTTNRSFLGHLISQMLKVALIEEMKQLRLSALEVLLTLITKEIDEENLSKSLVGFIPGICAHTIKIINGSIKQSHLITQAAVKCFSMFIQLVLNDNYLPSINEISGEAKETQWLLMAQTKLHVIFGEIVINPESHWKIKIEIVNMLRGIAMNCARSLEPSLTLLIKKLIQLTADSNSEVKQAAIESVQMLADLPYIQFDSAVRQNLFDITTSLPRIVVQGNSRDQCLVLQELQGHLTLTGSRLEKSFLFSGLRERLLKGLLICATLETSQIVDSEERVIFRYLHDDSVIEALNSCCSSVGHFGNLDDIVEYFVEICIQQEMYIKESVYVTTHAIQHAEKDAACLRFVVKNYASALTEMETNRENRTFGRLMLQCIAKVARIMKDNFQDLLLVSLRPVLEKAGHHDYSSAASITLQAMADSLNVSSVSQLVESNYDYFAPQLSFQLCNIIRYPRAIDLLRALLNFPQIHVNQWLGHIVHQALKGLDQSHNTLPLPYVQVLELYCRAAGRRHAKQPEKQGNKHRNREMSFRELTDKFIEYRKNYEKSLCFTDDVEEVDAVEMNDEMNPEVSAQEKKEAIPEEVSLVSAILERCIKLLPQSDKQETLYYVLMETIRLSVAVLSPFENVILKKVHQLWSPLKYQLSSNCHLKQRQAFELLATLSHMCPDFLRQRVLTEVTINHLDFLRKEADNSRRSRNWKAHMLTQTYKLQKNMLKEYAPLMVSMQVPVLQVSQVLQVFSLYLNRHQIPELQDLARDGFCIIASYQPGMVWLTLHGLLTKRTLTLQGFPSVEVGTDNEDYTVNSEYLVQKLFLLKSAEDDVRDGDRRDEQQRIDVKNDAM